MDPRGLYRDIVELEKQLRELLRSNPLNAQDANVLRSRLIEKARLLTDAAPTFAAAREIEQVLWKPCFYKRIEDFRRRIRKYAAASSSDRNIREHFQRVSTEFQAFLNDATQFYETLRASFTTWLVTNRVSRIIATPGSSTMDDSRATTPPMSDAAVHTDKCRHSLHRCLVFLGDLARYRELHSQKAKKNFSAAEQYYHRALAVIPENGNPHNQLAVLATYVDAEAVAVYRYCRSLLIAQPFATAEENLALLFERSRQRPLAPPSTAIITVASPSKDKSAYLKSFLHRVTRMHGILFSIATQEPTASKPLPVYSKEMEALLMKDMTTLLGSGVLADALVLKLVVTNVFCIVRAKGTLAMDDALRLATRMVTCVMSFLLTELNRNETNKPSTHGETSSSPSVLRLLGPVSTYCDFVRLNADVVDEYAASLSGAETSEQQPSLTKKCIREWLDSLVLVLNHPRVQSATTTVGADKEKVVAQLLHLKENIELRGFRPLSALVDAGSSSKWRDELVVAQQSNGGNYAVSPHQHNTSLSEQDAWNLRAWNLVVFGTFLSTEYEGNPLLYASQGRFSTTPFASARNGLTSSASSIFPPPSTFGLGLFDSTVPQQRAVPATTADDFDDEVIVYQPSPALAPVAPGSSALGGESNRALSSTFGGSDFSLGGQRNGAYGHPPPPSQVSTRENRAVTSDGLFSDTSFQSFGGFSGAGLLSAWGSDAASAKPSVTSFSQSFVTAPSASLSSSTTPPLPQRHSSMGRLFGEMDDLDAIERESSLYQQKESSLSALFGGGLTRSSSSSGFAFGAAPRPQRAVSSGPRLSPPPGFAGTVGGVGSDPLDQPVPPRQPQAHPTQPFFTRNPFVNP